MSTSDVIARAFDERASSYDESAMHRHVAETVSDFADLTAVDDVLDIATGTGLVLRALRTRAARLHLMGVDVSSGMLDVARQTQPTVDWIEADAAALPVSAASVDLVTCVTALHIIPNLDGAIAEWRRVLRSDGRVVTATFSRTAGRSSTDSAELTPDRPYPRRHAPFRSPDILRKTMAGHGFTLDRHVTWSDGTDEILIAELSITAA